jgi:BMFP domain-containing protein YqiC
LNLQNNSEAAMQTENRWFDDIARAANGALGALSGLRDEIESQVRSRVDNWLKAQNFVTREEFEAVKAMAAKARLENEELSARLVRLEAGRSGSGEAPEI